MKYRLRHITRYVGTEPISVGHNQAWLRPRVLPYQEVEDYRLVISPKPSVCTERLDSFGNNITTFSFNEGYTELQVESQGQIDVQPRFAARPKTRDWQTVVQGLDRHTTEYEFQASPFRFDSALAFAFEEATSYAAESFPAGQSLSAGACDLMRRIHEDFQFDPQTTSISTPVTEVLQQRSGVCQDFAHVMISMLRGFGIAARYVSGYIRTYPPPGQSRLVGADASHAWVSVYCGPEFGWLDLDPTNNKLAGEEHLTIAWGRDYSDIPPLRGVFLGGGQPHLHVSVDVEPLAET